MRERHNYAHVGQPTSSVLWFQIIFLTLIISSAEELWEAGWEGLQFAPSLIHFIFNLKSQAHPYARETWQMLVQ